MNTQRLYDWLMKITKRSTEQQLEIFHAKARILELEHEIKLLNYELERATKDES